MLQTQIAKVQVAQDSDSEIIRKVLRGEKDEFRHLVLRYQDQIYASIRRQVRDSQCAEELLQDCFVRAFRGLSGFRFHSSFATWLTGIALNLTNSYFSSKRYKMKKREELLGDEEMKSCNSENESMLKEKRVEVLRSAVMELPLKLRETVVLCGFEGKSYEEAASILKIPIGTVRSRLNQARNQLRETISKEE